VIDLETLSLSPERVGDLTRDELAQLLARVKSLEGVVLAALLTGDGVGATSPNESLDADAPATPSGTRPHRVLPLELAPHVVDRDVIPHDLGGYDDDE